MRLNVSRFRTPKGGSTEAEYEDASAWLPEPAEDGEIHSDAFQTAISDGASESLLAGRWAQALAQGFTAAEPMSFGDRDVFSTTVSRLATDWEQTVVAYVDERKASGRPVKWYEQPGLERGAFATLLACRFTEFRWQAAALGDSCVFQVRDERLVASFPLHESAAFGTQPSLLNSVNRDPKLVTKHAVLTEGTCEQHDQFYFCTDALAAWFLDLWENGERPWETLRDLGTDALPCFDSWIAEQRALGFMKNDDVTLLRVEVW